MTPSDVERTDGSRSGERDRPNEVVTVAAVAFALVGLSALDAAVPGLSDRGLGVRVVRSVGIDLLVVGAVLGVVVGIERRPLSSIGLERPDRRDLAWALAAVVVGVLTFAVSEPIVQALGGSSTGRSLERLSAAPTWVVALLAVVVAPVVEEVLFRGYPIERLTGLLGDARIAGAVTVLAFTAAHVPFWGLGAAVQIGLWSVVVTVLYVRRRNLPACVLTHFLNNAFAYLLLPRLLGG